MNKNRYSALIKNINGMDGAFLENHINFTGATKETGSAFEKKLKIIHLSSNGAVRDITGAYPVE